ncbi:uncharacterized protein N7479_003859 [Penicillium vulpinum]|uniref:Reverse transcriptase Ty1/copia-type domain-containing protein n=1 Tax=Penicillium vulpinum TaxID=29845 RepID=A0A1V6RG48_9EURO|nr:uncharacterized protein N7479_003859 [Penicillium vulpinum]KAJ5963983.1 hypothetical protein N7479_003859 [Penicillium vulpinum]OQE00510.1 hypothetical protein PENVUL_c050G03359 [Penicillium vulpinum]
MADQIDNVTAKATYEVVNHKNEVYGFKARWVVCGNHQQKKEDSIFYSPVISNTLVKIIFTIVAQRNYAWKQFDAVAVYLNASREHEEVIYVIQPPGFEYSEPEIGPKGWVCQLNQALYGLRDSAKLWNEDLNIKLNNIGFVPLDDDPCVYIKGSGETAWYLIVHVDDFIAAAPTKEEVDQIFKEVQSEFDIKDIGEPSRFLGSAVVRDYKNRTITLSQQVYIEEILRLAEMQNCKEAAIPLSSSWIWDNENEDPETLLHGKEHTRYRSIVGRLNWLAVETRPDIKFAVMKLQHRAANPTERDLQAARQVYCYLKRTKDFAITLGCVKDQRFYAYTDTSHGDWPDKKSTEGTIWFFAGAPII